MKYDISLYLLIHYTIIFLYMCVLIYAWHFNFRLLFILLLFLSCFLILMNGYIVAIFLLEFTANYMPFKYTSKVLSCTLRLLHCLHCVSVYDAFYAV